MLLEHGADPNIADSQGRTALMYAVIRKGDYLDEPAIRALLASAQKRASEMPQVTSVKLRSPSGPPSNLPPPCKGRRTRTEKELKMNTQRSVAYGGVLGPLMLAVIPSAEGFVSQVFDPTKPGYVHQQVHPDQPLAVAQEAAVEAGHAYLIKRVDEWAQLITWSGGEIE